MSNRASKLQETIKQKKAKEDLELYATLPGSIITSIGILSGTNRETIRENFVDFKKKFKSLENKDWTVEKLVEYAYNQYGNCSRSLLGNLVLLVDTRGFYTPLVAIIKDDEVMPLDPKGLAFGVIGMARSPEHSELVEVEYVFDEDGTHYDDYDELEHEMR